MAREEPAGEVETKARAASPEHPGARAEHTAVAFDQQSDISRMLNPGAERRQPLPGFDEEYIDIVDYIIRSTYKVWNWRLLNKINDYHVANFLFHGASGREAYGRGNYAAYVLSLLAMFPDAAVYIDDFHWNGNGRHGYRTAVRWTLLGTHTGPGAYGEPTNRQIQMNGITQHLVREGRYVEEWTLFNELQILQQLWCGR